MLLPDTDTATDTDTGTNYKAAQRSLYPPSLKREKKNRTYDKICRSVRQNVKAVYLEQGWRTYGARAQKTRRKISFGTRNSLLSQLLRFFYPPPASRYCEECVQNWLLRNPTPLRRTSVNVLQANNEYSLRGFTSLNMASSAKPTINYWLKFCHNLPKVEHSYMIIFLTECIGKEWKIHYKEGIL